MTEFYNKPLDYAREHGEFEQWRDSRKENLRCATELEKLIAENHDGYHLDTDKIIKSAVGEFGTERVSVVLAATIQRRDWDGRFLSANKEWAKSIDVPDGENSKINVNSHSTLIDGVVRQYKKFLLELEKIPSESRNNNDFRMIDADTAVGMIDHGFSVYMDGTDRRITYEQYFEKFEVKDLDQHILFAPHSEFEQNKELETLTDDIDRLNDEVRAKDPVNSIDNYAKDKAFFEDTPIDWRDSRSEWEYIHTWLNDISENFEVGQLDDRLTSYEDRYKRDTVNHDNIADLSATRGETGGIKMADHNTTFEVSSMTKIENGGNVKALANVVINGEVAVNGVKVVEGKDGNLFTAMPSKKIGNEYVDVAHATTKEAHESLNNAVLSNYEKLAASPENTLKNDLGFDKTKAAVSDIKVTLREVDHDVVKASGQINIDDCFVVKDVKVMKPKDPEKPEFVSMPSYANNKGTYTDYACPITTAMHEKIDNAVMNSYRNIEKVEYKGVKYAELGDKDKGEIAATPRLNNKFAEKLMGELDNAGVKYQARIGANSGTVISVNTADKQKLDTIKENLVKALNPEKEKPKTEGAPTQDNKPKQKHTKH